MKKSDRYVTLTAAIISARELAALTHKKAALYDLLVKGLEQERDRL